MVDFLCSDVRMAVEGDMEKWRVVLGSLVVLALVWAALHDIIKGEQDVWMEWLFVFISFTLLIVVVYKWLKVKSNNQ